MTQVLSTFTGFLQITPQMILESERSNDGRVIVQGVLQRANAKNQNQRVYPKELLTREVESYKKKINEGLSGGELDHPDSSVVNLKNVSHKITNLWWNNDDVVGTIEILSTPAGNIAKELIKSGIQLGVSSRGMGSTTMKEGKTIVNDDFNLICWDLVSEPSTHGAYLYPMNENVDKTQMNQKLNNINDLIIRIMETKL